MALAACAALWFPDWPLQAAKIADESLTGAVASIRNNHVEVCNAEARAQGVRRGMRTRQAQTVCPTLTVVEANTERDGALFSAIVNSLDDVTAAVEVLRPGLVVFDARAAVRFHGGKAVEMATDAVARQGIDVVLGMADEIATAVIAARTLPAGELVAPGKSQEFLSRQPVQVLSAEPALGIPAEFTQQCQQLGLSTLGDVASVSLRHVLNRFGAVGGRAYDIVTARDEHKVAPEEKTAELAVAMAPAEPIERVDAAAFAARQLAAQLHEKLAAAGVVCVRLKVRAEFHGGGVVERIWRNRDALEEQATADRVRWQLDGWLQTARTAEAEAGIVELVLEPVEVQTPEFIGQLWGKSASDDKAKRVIARVQSTLGVDKVVQPHSAGGRGVVERVGFVPYGEDADAPSAQPWVGAVPSPMPALAHPAARIGVVDATGTPVTVTAEALLSAQPYGISWGAQRYLVTGWAGPWPVDESWWDEAAARRLARLQGVGENVKDSSPQAWLLQWVGRQWRVEATYS